MAFYLMGLKPENVSGFLQKSPSTMGTVMVLCLQQLPGYSDPSGRYGRVSNHDFHIIFAEFCKSSGGLKFG